MESIAVRSTHLSTASDLNPAKTRLALLATPRYISKPAADPALYRKSLLILLSMSTFHLLLTNLILIVYSIVVRKGAELKKIGIIVKAPLGEMRSFKRNPLYKPITFH